MPDTHGRTGEPGRYRFHVEGHLDARWSGWFDGLDVVTQPDGTTVFEGLVPDQAALHGVLQRIRDLALPLVSVARIPFEAHPGAAQPR